MKQVKIKTSKLIDVLQNNRKKHVEEYNEAFQKYKEDVISKMKENLIKAENNEKIITYIKIPEPFSQEKDYDLAIEMLEMTTEDEVILTMNEFRQYVMDEWSWKESFISTNSAYNKFSK